MTPLQSRKKLLIAESELNRAQMVHEWGLVAEEARSLVRQAGNLGSLASTTASLVATLAGFQGAKSEAPAKSSWLQTILKGGGLISTIWMAFRARKRNRSQNPQ